MADKGAVAQSMRRTVNELGGKASIKQILEKQGQVVNSRTVRLIHEVAQALEEGGLVTINVGSQSARGGIVLFTRIQDYVIEEIKTWS